MIPKGSEVYFRIIPGNESVSFQKVDLETMYNNVDGGFVRKAILPAKKMRSIPQLQRYQDSQFKIQNSNQYRLVRLYDLYQKQIPLFPEDQVFSSFIQSQKIYPSFLAESGVISFDYLCTLFITQNVNKQGYYQYFVKRNGEYFLQDCDDFIPVDRKKWKPLWSLNTMHPWQLILLKAWIKQCGSFQNIYKAQPFRFLQAFGLPIYGIYNFRKELHFIKNERLPTQKRKTNENNLAMNKQSVIIIGKTLDDKSVQKVGLLPNYAGYRILRITDHTSTPLYRVYSSLPCYWVGEYSPVINTNLNNIFKEDMYLDLQRNFILTQQQVTKYFNKFYVVPFQVSQTQRIVTQDCINLNYVSDQPIWLCFDVKSPQGMLAVSIQLPKLYNQKKRYPQFKYFLSKQKNQQQINRSHYRPDVRGAEREGNKYIESNCDKWDYYAIDYVQGYHNWGSFFCKAVQGFYVLYIDANGYTGPINVRFDAYLTIGRPEIYKPGQAQIKQIFDSTFFSISQDMAVQASLNNDTFQQSIALNNAFEEIGFGSISVRTLTKATHLISMKVYQKKFQEIGLRLVASNHSKVLQKDQKGQYFVLMSSKGRPQIIVLQKIYKKSQNTLGKQFPPSGTVQFFKIYPLSSNTIF